MVKLILKLYRTTNHYHSHCPLSVVAKDLLSKMLNPHPLSRASLEEIKSHPWMQAPRHLTRHPAKSFLLATHKQSQESISLNHTELEHRSHCKSNERDQIKTYPKVERKNSSGYFSSCTSEFSSSSNPPSPTRAH